ncbi:MAG: hypothetical protein AAFP13_08105 [Pseudomonadota bacterium]
MALKYDIDILPDSAADAAGPYVAAFRDPATAQAARDADPRIGVLLQEAGISLEPSGSATPAGHFPCADAGTRAYVAACLESALEDAADTPRRDPITDFDVSDFAKSVATARPFGALVVVPEPQERTPMKVGVAFGIMSFSGYLAGFAGII